MANTPKPVRKAIQKLKPVARENGKNAARGGSQTKPAAKPLAVATKAKGARFVSKTLNKAHVETRAKTMAKDSKDPKVANQGAAARKESKNSK